MNNPTSLMDIFDKAYELVDNRIDVIRESPGYRQANMFAIDKRLLSAEMGFLKDLRDILKMGENFRDDR